ncbi:uncharacterized protein N7459_004156 [Penicillium hispanicum]|uniref:uncharacterized protein n=1 Tax=Penicillium hispanicum TaxID=1080232 RepID=UPI002541F23D|nr:uncharacterized protein N7459_004156 [Penicillium hispanicum]KAJ5584356.1 hypothetical protein N7459_004156 [Penicillium hispanicum]
MQKVQQDPNTRKVAQDGPGPREHGHDDSRHTAERDRGAYDQGAQRKGESTETESGQRCACFDRDNRRPTTADGIDSQLMMCGYGLSGPKRIVWSMRWVKMGRRSPSGSEGGRGQPRSGEDGGTRLNRAMDRDSEESERGSRADSSTPGDDQGQ